MTTDLISKPKRLLSLDAFRGITIAMMIMVNNPGSWSTIYPPLRHASWNGCTMTDLIFPFFLFIAGVAVPLALSERVLLKFSTKELYLKIFKRVFILFGIGLFLSGFRGVSPTILLILFSILVVMTILKIFITIKQSENKEKFTQLYQKGLLILFLSFIMISVFKFDFTTIRIPGVLQRIAICYMFGSIIFLHTDVKKQVYIIIGLLSFYWLAVKLIPVPGYGPGILEPTGNLCWYIDNSLLSGHTWSGAPSKGFDPEGIFSTLPAIATLLIGILTGQWVKSNRDDYEKVSGLFVAGTFLLLSGYIASAWLPINKNLWTSSYSMYTAGMALLFLGSCYWLVDIKHIKNWTKPFVIFGSNAIVVYSLSSFGARIMGSYLKINYHGQIVSLKSYIFSVFSEFLSPINASLFYSIFYLLIWFILALILYKRKIFIKV